MPGKVVDILVKKDDLVNPGRPSDSFRCDENGKYTKV